MAYFSGLMLLYVAYKLLRWAISKFSNFLKTFQWREVRPKDLIAACGALAFIAGVEYAFPIFEITGRAPIIESQNSLHTENKGWTGKILTFDEISDLAPWLSGFNSRSLELLILENKTLVRKKESANKSLLEAKARYLEASLKLVDFEKSHPNSSAEKKGTDHFKIALSKKVAGNILKGAHDRNFIAQQAQNKVGREIKNSGSGKIFPKFSTPIEVFKTRIKVDTSITIRQLGDKSFVSFIKKLIVAFQKPVRPTSNWKRQISCFVSISDDSNGQPHAQRSCELVLPIAINYDITQPGCDKRYTIKGSPFRLEYSSDERVACIEKWNFPNIHIEIEDSKVIFHEPQIFTTNAKLPDYSPITSWGIIIGDARYTLDGLRKIEFLELIKNQNKFDLVHFPKREIDKFLSGKTTKNSAKNSSARIWNNFDLEYIFPQWKNRLINSPEFSNQHAFSQSVLRVNHSFFIELAQGFTQSAQDVTDSKNGRVLLHLKERADMVDKLFRLDGEYCEQKNRLAEHSLNSTGRQTVRINPWLTNLLESDGKTPNCEKVDAVRKIIDSLRAYYSR